MTLELGGGVCHNTNTNMKTKYKRNHAGIYLEMPEIVQPAGYVGLYIHDAKTGQLKSLDLFKNMFVTAGKVAIADRIRGEDKGEITYCAVGTSNTAPDLTDTQLGAELARKLISVREQNPGAANASDFTTFFNTSEANGNIEELGLFGDGATATADSGTLFARTLKSRVKTSNDTMTAVWTVIIG